ncbi:phosphogluconate dehydrogenase C-terminal domain-containing protein [Paenibacillus sp. 1P07SE]|uniref:phosphogluconate dehydrogenase C-terminal domain-containing protein n=1 Tax=Paenibacillus sp. 1P07SE TaxID=3132209 RepID=UPI0039A567CE
MKPVIALIGAGGKMGCRLTDRLRHAQEYEMRYVEISEAGLGRLAERGLPLTPQPEAVREADVVILAVPDALIGTIAAGIVPEMQPGALLMLLDPAAAYLGMVPERSEIAVFLAHPCHPPIFGDETDPQARRDFFGGIHAKQSIVCALMRGSEQHYKLGEAIARTMYAPILRSHRITLEQMAMLEPSMAETVGATCATILKEAMDEAVRRGVPAEAARDFMLGHINIELAIVFGEAGNPFSDAALVAIEYGKQQMLRPDWKNVFEPDSLRHNIDLMLHPGKLEQASE